MHQFRVHKRGPRRRRPALTNMIASGAHACGAEIVCELEGCCGKLQTRELHVLSRRCKLSLAEGTQPDVRISNFMTDGLHCTVEKVLELPNISLAC